MTHRFLVTYADNSMIELHLAPHAREFSNDSDAETTMQALAWIAGLHGIAPNSITLESMTDDYTDVINATSGESIGQITFDYMGV